MAESRLSTLREVWASKIVKLLVGAWALVASYDGVSSQFELPKLGKVVGMSGNLLPWWGWLLILQAIFVYGLFEYVRRLQSPVAAPEPLSERGVPVVVDRFLVDVTGRVGKLEADAKRFESVSREVAEYQATHRRVIDDYQRMSAWETDTRDKLKVLQDDADKARHSLHAIYSRERLGALAITIEREASELYDRLHAGDSYDQNAWLQWEAALGRWEVALSDWTQDGKWYAHDVSNRVYTIDDRHYAANWTVKDGQFPDSESLSRSEAVRRFKKFRITHEQWRSVRKDVENGLIQVAYVGLTSKEVQQRPPL